MRTPTPLRRRLAIAALALLGSCANTGVRGGDYCVLDARSGDDVELVDSVEELAAADVVFFGELHDNDVGHRLQLLSLRLLHQRRPELVVSLEQFELDAQPWIDAYLAGEIDEELFLAHARPWPNYGQHYRPIVEYAREHGLPVVAANIPRPLASRVAKGGLWNVAAEEMVPWVVWTDEPEYAHRFAQAMGGHGAMGFEREARFFAAQCLKDETMARSIAEALPAGGGPLVVHLCGRFHSDHRLGTVSRLARRRPELALAVVSQSAGDGLGRPLEDDERDVGDFVWRVPPAAAD